MAFITGTGGLSAERAVGNPQLMPRLARVIELMNVKELTLYMSQKACSTNNYSILK